jgi:hypothetical protein
MATPRCLPRREAAIGVVRWLFRPTWWDWLMGPVGRGHRLAMARRPTSSS